MIDLIKQMVEDKKEYREQLARIKALPEDYQFVMEKIYEYMWSFSAGLGSDVLKIHTELLDLFEAGVAEGKLVLEITGEDVTSFCDELMHNTKKWNDGTRKRLNDKISKKLGERGGK